MTKDDISNTIHWSSAMLQNPEVENDKDEQDQSANSFNVHRFSIEIRGVFFIFLRQHRQILCLCIQFRENCTPLEDIINILNHNSLDILELCIDGIDIPATISEGFLCFLDVHIEFNEGIGSRHRIHLSPIILVKFLRNIFQIVECQALGVHFIT